MIIALIQSLQKFVAVIRGTPVSRASYRTLPDGTPRTLPSGEVRTLPL